MRVKIKYLIILDEKNKNSIESIIYSQNLYVQILEMLVINNRSDQKKFVKFHLQVLPRIVF